MALPRKVINAMSWYCQEQNLRPMMCAYPLLSFVDERGNIVNVQAANLLIKYDNRKKKEEA